MRPKTHSKSILMITLFTLDCKEISQESYDILTEQLQIHSIRCSCGCRGSMIRHGFYRRTFKSITGTRKLKILRLKCSSCGVTHALLPVAVVPYSQVSLDCQLTMIRYKMGSPEMEQVQNANPDFDEGCISRVRRKYRTHWAQRLKAEGLCPVMEWYDLVKTCFSRYRRQFLQIRAGCNLLFGAPT